MLVEFQSAEVSTPMSHLTSGTDVKDGFPDVKGGGHEVVCNLVVVREDEVVESYSCHYH